MADLRFLAEQTKSLAGVGDALGGLADAELKGVAGRAHDQERARRDHRQQVAGRRVGRSADVDLAHAAGGREISVVGADAADRDDGRQPLVGRTGVKRLVSASGRTGDGQPGRVDFGPRDQVIDGPRLS